MAIPFNDRRTGEILYHGTNADLSVGDVIKPATEVGASRHGELPFGPAKWGHSYAHASTDSHMSDMFATSAVFRQGGNPRVYKVAPVNPDDVEVVGLTRVSSSGFKVVGEVPHDPTQQVWKHVGNRVGYFPENYGK